MEYGKDKNTSAQHNLIQNKTFGLIQNNEGTIPAWAASIVYSADEDYKTKLINTFFKANVEMKKIISDLGKN